MSRSETESGRDGFMGVPGSEKSSVHRLSASRPGGKRWLGRHVLTAERAGHNYYLPLDAGGKHFSAAPSEKKDALRAAAHTDWRSARAETSSRGRLRRALRRSG